MTNDYRSRLDALLERSAATDAAAAESLAELLTAGRALADAMERVAVEIERG
jgi:hypothetical protein